MKRLLPYLFILLIASFAQLSAETIQKSRTPKKAAPPTIKVLLEESIDGVLLEVRGSYQIFNPLNNKKISTGLRGKRFYLYPHEKGLKWGENFPGIFQLRIVPSSFDSTILVNGIQYRGCLEVYNIDNTLRIINEVDIESYLKSILPQSMSSKFPEKVLDAIAIVARTNACYISSSNKEANWHIDANEAKYQGHGVAYSNYSINKAIDNTRNLVMTFQESPFASAWTENCAGKTASFQTIFRKNTNSPSGVFSNFAALNRDENNWTYHMNSEFLANLLKLNRVTGLDLFIDEESKKVYAIRVKDGERHEDIDFVTLQKMLGENPLPSNEFQVELKGNTLLFNGFGEGLGVGLCLYSATQLAQMGENVPSILATFYPYTHLEKIDSPSDLEIKRH